MMRFVKLSGGMLAAILVFLATSAFAETTLWLVRPLYPGQEALVERTEKALDKLIAATERQDHVIGRTELAAALKGRKVDELPCLGAGERCADPIDPFVATLGFGRIVMVQGGQDEAGFKFRVVSYEPALNKVMPATSAAPVLEKALLGAVAKVVPVASTLEVKSTPPGATVYIDDTKMGVTPLTTQVLPGERVIKIDLKLHQPIEETLVIPIKGSASLEKSLDKVAARLIVTAAPAGTSISIDGQPVAKDRIDRGILPGQHVIRLTAENHKAFEQTISVKPDEQYVLDKTLEPLPGAVVIGPTRPPDTMTVVVKNQQPDQAVKVTTPLPPPPAPASETELTYEKRSYFQLSYEYGSLLGNSLVGRRWGNSGTGRTTSIDSPSRLLMGGSLEYGTGGKYFGVAVVGISYLTNVERFNLGVGYAPGAQREVDMGITGPSSISNTRIHMVTIRALQPQLRLAAWRFMFQLQVGAEFRTGQIIEPAATTFYKDGFMILDLLAAARLNVRFFIVEGLYFFGSGHFTYYILGESSRLEAPNDGMMPPMTTGPEPAFNNSHQWGFNVGLGYGF
ncbi:MAG: PEGA domain-containing protein [Myxococcales bacterium]|nr:PEGA domain-containing protein [Myxococcales bacterium]